LHDYLRELGLELVIDVLEGAAEVGELLTGLIGDKHLGQAVPVDRLAGLRRRVGHLLHHPVPAHLARLAPPPPPIRVHLGDRTGTACDGVRDGE